MIYGSSQISGHTLDLFTSAKQLLQRPGAKQGVGNFVREQPSVRRYGIGRYSRSVWGGTDPQRLLDAEGARQGRAVGQETETDQVPAPVGVAERLTGVSKGDPVHVRHH